MDVAFDDIPNKEELEYKWDAVRVHMNSDIPQCRQRETSSYKKVSRFLIFLITSSIFFLINNNILLFFQTWKRLIRIVYNKIDDDDIANLPIHEEKIYNMIKEHE